MLKLKVGQSVLIVKHKERPEYVGRTGVVDDIVGVYVDVHLDGDDLDGAMARPGYVLCLGADLKRPPKAGT